MSTRTNVSDLADPKEFWEMMEKEPKRAPVTDEHFPDFGLATRWLEMAGDKTNFFDLETIEQMRNVVDAVKQQLVAFTLANSGEKIYLEIENYLGEEDEINETADLAFVFGSKSLLRAEKGIELYKNGKVKKLVMIGKGPYYEQPETTEADNFKRHAISLGVPEKDILIESESFNLAGNVRGTLNMLDKQNVKYKSVALVIPWFGLRRVWVFMKKYALLNTKIYRTSAALSSGSKFAKEEWYKTREGIEVVFNEFVKMRDQVVTNTG